jgi:ankyrin repeat protein
MGDARAIVDAAHKGDLEEVRRLVQQDRGLLDVDHGWQGDSYTPLTAAAWAGRVEVMRYLLEEGAQVNLRDEDGSSALECACYNGTLVCFLHMGRTLRLRVIGAPPR